MQAFIRKITKKITGKNISKEVPLKLLIGLSLSYSNALLRGIIFGKGIFFLFPGVTIIGKSNCNFGRYCTLGKNTKIISYANNVVKFGEFAKIGDYSIVSCTSSIKKIGYGFELGNHSGFGEFCYFGSVGGIVIGDNVIGGQYVSFHSENHIVSVDDKNANFSKTKSDGISIGNNCWVGAKVTFLDGVHIGNNCIVAAGAVVTKSYGDNVVIAGVPAKIVKEVK